MRKQLSLFVLAAVMFGVGTAGAATNFGTRAGSSVDLTGAPATRTRTNVDYEKYQTRTLSRTYDASDAKNMYYTQPAKRSDLYKQYTNSQTNVRTTRSETLRSELKRKYFLAHPFFQPVGGKFGSVTDLSYSWNSYDIALTPAANFGGESAAKWDMTQLSIKEDFSYGITDTIAVLGMLKYDSSDYKFDWASSPDDKMDDNGLNMFGLGAQWRFVDNAEWIATASAYYQHQKDVADNFILDLKAGYKISSSTIYGLVRGWYVDLDGDTYGNGITGKTDQGFDSTIFLAYNMDASDIFYVEGGLGVFSVLEEDWTLNAEAVFGNYDWHNQLSAKVAFGWQPNDWFALNLYGKIALYDSADGKNVPVLASGYLDSEDNVSYVWNQLGTAKIDNYSEATVGLQAIFMF